MIYHHCLVIPAKAGTQGCKLPVGPPLGPRFRGGDGEGISRKHTRRVHQSIFNSEKPDFGLTLKYVPVKGLDLVPKKEKPDKASAMMVALDWAYDKAVNGVPKLDRAEDLANNYLIKARSPDEAIDSLIAWQIGKAGTAGFLTGLGGALTLPIAVPANVASVLWVQIPMVAAIAYIRGFDIRSDQVKTLVLACLAGSSTADVLKDFGINVGSKLTQQAIARISGATLGRVNPAVGFRLITKAGSRGAVNLSKIVPFIGGIVGGSFDAVVTRAIGRAANNLFSSDYRARNGDGGMYDRGDQP